MSVEGRSVDVDEKQLAWWRADEQIERYTERTSTMSTPNGDRRSVATDALDTLGTAPLDENQKRDAIHIAVEPVIAGERLNPGERIAVVDGIATSAEGDDVIGIVDPFLTKAVRKGQRFWFLMLPRMVRSLRHVWTHPAFPDEPVAAGRPDKKATSEKWLRDFIASADCPDYDHVMALIAEGTLPSPDRGYYRNGGEFTEDYLHFSGSDAHGEIPPEFWDHVEVVLGRKPQYRPSSFSCSC
jgi:hypothetical protein